MVPLVRKGYLRVSAKWRLSNSSTYSQNCPHQFTIYTGHHQCVQNAKPIVPLQGLPFFKGSQWPLRGNPHSQGMRDDSRSGPCCLQSSPTTLPTPLKALTFLCSLVLFRTPCPSMSAQWTPIQPSKLSSSMPYSGRFPPAWLCPSPEDSHSIPGTPSLWAVMVWVTGSVAAA